MEESPLFTCPKCETKLRVPDSLRGKVVRCLECQSQSISPALDNNEGKLKALPPSLKSGLYPAHIFIPMMGLLLLGTAGMIVNGYYAVQFRRDPISINKYAESTLAQMSATNLVKQKDAKASEEAERAEKAKAEEIRKNAEILANATGKEMIRKMDIFFAVSVLVVLGGLSFACGRLVWLAWIGCLAAIVNIQHGCCFPGFIAGIWGMFTLISDEGLKHYQKK
jgi:hypothetical protein